MAQEEYNKMKEQIGVLEELLAVYSGRTIDNIVVQLKARVREVEKERKTA
jgi:hypothetical protein